MLRPADKKVVTNEVGVDDGLPKGLDGIAVPKWRRQSLKAYGNAIVPQVAYRIFQAIGGTFPMLHEKEIGEPLEPLFP